MSTPSAVDVTEEVEPAVTNPRAYKKNMTVDAAKMEVAMDLELQWDEAPQRVVLIKKLKQPDIDDDLFVDMILWLREKHPALEMLVETTAMQNMAQNHRIGEVERSCQVFAQGEDLGDVDLVISFGGDGTLLHATSLFPRQLPPVLGFRTGTLNFLVPFSAASYASVLEDVWAGSVLVNLRTRIAYTLKTAQGEDKEDHTALNEVAVTRGCDPHLCKVDIYMNKQRLSRIEGDGILICSPTGSTAYSLAAGGSVLHPSVPALQIVPIAPHSICTRAVVVPCTAEITFRLAETSRSHAVVASDGIKSFQMTTSDVLHLKTSAHPLPLLYSRHNKPEVEPSDWLKSFHWCQKLVAPGTDDGGKVPEPASQPEVKCKPCSLLT